MKKNKISRIKNILTYFFEAMFATFKVGKQDYFLAISQPPVLGGLLGVWGKIVKHAKFVYNIQDFNPEQVIAVGYTKSKLITGAMMFFDKFSCRCSNLIITVGSDLVETVEHRDVHWCVNAKGIKGVSCPSKAYGIMAAGKAILGVLENGTEIRGLIERCNCGRCCEPEDYVEVVLCQDLAQNKMRSSATKLLTENRPSHTFFRSR